MVEVSEVHGVQDGEVPLPHEISVRVIIGVDRIHDRSLGGVQEGRIRQPEAMPVRAAQRSRGHSFPAKSQILYRTGRDGGTGMIISLTDDQVRLSLKTVSVGAFDVWVVSAEMERAAVEPNLRVDSRLEVWIRIASLFRRDFLEREVRDLIPAIKCVTYLLLEVTKISAVDLRRLSVNIDSRRCRD